MAGYFGPMRNGLYIHIPYCRKACHYCNFHFSTSSSTYSAYIDAILKEIELKGDRNFLSSIYFGGGTPSIMSIEDLTRLLDAVFAHFDITELEEVTLEANPEDITDTYVKGLKTTAVDRISLGLQALEDEDLKWMNRNHTAAQSLDAIKRLRDAGFENISVDLVFGYDMLESRRWHENLQQIIQLQLPHISHYGLTVEPRTYFDHLEKKGQKIIDEDALAIQMQMLYQGLANAGYRNYELSNSATPGFEAVHNSIYWKSLPYIGIGASAHGYDGDRMRYQNIANTPHYIENVISNTPYAEFEKLSDRDILNEYIMTRLRTDMGILWEDFLEIFTMDERIHICTEMKNFDPAWYRLDEKSLSLTYMGWVWSDFIFRGLFA